MADNEINPERVLLDLNEIDDLITILEEKVQNGREEQADTLLS